MDEATKATIKDLTLEISATRAIATATLGVLAAASSQPDEVVANVRNHALDAVKNMASDFRFGCADGSFEMRLLGDYVGGGSGADLADGDDGRVKRVGFT